MAKAKHKYWKVTLTDGVGVAFEGIGKTKAAATADARELAGRRRGVSGQLLRLTESDARKFESTHKPRAFK